MYKLIYTYLKMSLSVRELRSKNDEVEFINGNKNCMIFWGSKSCGHCVNSIPFIEKMKMKYPNVSFSHVEVSEIPTDNIDGVPVFVGYSNGRPVEQIVGKNEGKIIELLDTLSR